MNGSRMTSLREDEKTGILYRKWEAPSSKTVLLLVHGINAHSGRWQFLADFFLKNNVSSYAIELEGFGQPKDAELRRAESLGLYYNDIRRLRTIITEECPGSKIFIVGESAGAIISFLTVIEEPRFFEGLVCISPAFTSKLNLALSDYIKIFLSTLYNPGKQFIMPITSAMCTRDVDYQKIIDSELEEHERITSRLLIDLAIAQIRCRILKNKIRVPVLFLVAGRDVIVNSAASVAIFNSLKVADKKIIQYPDMHHSLSVEMGRESVFQDIFKWLREL